MPPASDYATMPAGAGAVESKEERNAELILARLADARLVMSSRTSVKIATIVLVVSQVVTGLWLRNYLVPRGWEVAVACAFLVILALAAPAMSRGAGRKEPQWARAAAAHERSLPGRVPEEMLGMLREFTASMTAGTRWRGDARIHQPVHGGGRGALRGLLRGWHLRNGGAAAGGPG
jgi:hypothetical protein